YGGEGRLVSAASLDQAQEVGAGRIELDQLALEDQVDHLRAERAEHHADGLGAAQPQQVREVVNAGRVQLAERAVQADRLEQLAEGPEGPADGQDAAPQRVGAEGVELGERAV